MRSTAVPSHPLASTPSAFFFFLFSGSLRVFVFTFAPSSAFRRFFSLPPKDRCQGPLLQALLEPGFPLLPFGVPGAQAMDPFLRPIEL